MAATYNWCEDNGAATGSPAHGTTRSGNGNTTYSTDCNWKNVDDCTANTGTAYSSAPITAGNNSFNKYHYGKFSGTFNQISSGKFAANCSSTGTAGSATAAGLTIKSTVTSTYATPATTAITATDNSAGTATSSGNAVSFSTTGPEAASPTSTLSAAGYSQYLESQLQTTTSAAAGDITTTYIGIQYNEN